MTIKAVIFDMGGVILRTEDPGKREAMAQRLGTTRRDLEYMLFLSPSALETEFGRITEVEHIHNVLKHYGQAIEDHAHFYNEFFCGDVMDEKVIDFIKDLKKNYKVGLLSNAWMNIRKNLSDYYDFVDIFNVSIFSAEVGLRKPDERIFKLILDRLGVEAQEAIFVDDFLENVNGAAEVGLHVVHFKNRDQAIADVKRILDGKAAV